jgi:thioredoxin-related protein
MAHMTPVISKTILLVFIINLADPTFSAPHADFDISSIDDSPGIRDNLHPEWFTNSFLNLKDDLKEAQAEGKLGIAIYFGQKDCAYCEKLLEINFSKEKDIVQYTRKHFNVIPINIWGSKEVIDINGKKLTEKTFAEQEKTHFTPSLIFYIDGGKEVLKLRGYYSPYKFQAALEYIVEGYFAKESLRDYMERADPPPKFEIGDMTTESFFDVEPYLLDRSHFPSFEPLAVFFEQTDCHACDIIHSEPLSDTQTQELLQRFQTVQLNMWSETPVLTPNGEKLSAKQWAEKLGIFYAPTLVFFDEQGTEIMRIDSIVRLYRLRGVLKYILSKGYQKAPTMQRWQEIQQRANKMELRE